MKIIITSEDIAKGRNFVEMDKQYEEILKKLIEKTNA